MLYPWDMARDKRADFDGCLPLRIYPSILSAVSYTHLVYTIVTDNVKYDDSPGKKIADEYWDLNIYDVHGIVKKAREQKVDGVISGWLDPCQRPYQEICEQLGVSCYGTPVSYTHLLYGIPQVDL